MEILIEILKEIPPGLDRWLFVLIGVALYFAPTIYRQFIKGRVRESELDEIKTLLEIKIAALEIAEREGKSAADLPKIINSNLLYQELFPREKAAEKSNTVIGFWPKAKYGLISSTAFFVIMALVHSNNLGVYNFSLWSIFLGEIPIIIISSLLMGFYPSVKRRPLIVMSIILPVILTMALILFRVL